MIDMSEYKGKVAVITGAASGMGLCMARKIVEAGGAAVMCDVNADVLAAVASEINARARVCVRFGRAEILRC